MAGIEVVSFDMEGTLIDDGYSNLIWETDIPRLYGEKHGLDLEIVYNEVPRTLERMSRDYTLIVSSNTIREFLEVQLTKLPDVFTKIYSAPSDLKTVKKTDSFYGRICGEMGVSPPSMAHVGDSFRFDYEEPRKLGIHSFFLDRRGETSGEHIVGDLDEFEDKLRFFS
jgi:FMN phosphatase YigB (HAD superfamily)